MVHARVMIFGTACVDGIFGTKKELGCMGVIWRLKRSEGGGFVFRKPVDRFIFDIEELWERWVSWFFLFLPLYEKEGVVISRFCSWTVPRGQLLSLSFLINVTTKRRKRGKKEKTGPHL